jgi:hypothetical protein
MDELREKIADLLERNDASLLTYEYGLELAKQILSLIKEAGWKSPEEVADMNDLWEETLEIYKDPKRRKKLEKRKQELMDKLKEGR